jgi:hypothetical protein
VTRTRHQGQHARTAHGDHGVASAEFLVVIVAVLLGFLVMLSYATRIHAERVAQAAAEEGAGAARRFDGTAAAARARAHEYADRVGGSSLRDVTVTATRGTRTVTVTVTGTAPELVPFLPLRVSATSRGPVERFVPEVDR